MWETTEMFSYNEYFIIMELYTAEIQPMAIYTTQVNHTAIILIILNL